LTGVEVAAIIKKVAYRRTAIQIDEKDAVRRAPSQLPAGGSRVRFRCGIFGLLIILALGVSSGALAQGKRVALIIGNAAYASGPLANPVNDATDMAAALKSVGFEVLIGTNANRRAMYELIDQFGNDIYGADIALFFYSGHGVQVGGDNYLIPVAAEIKVASDIELEGVGLQRVIGRMIDGGAGTNAIILDACRNNPFPKASRGMERGLAVVGQKPPESIIVYATEAGETADDGTGRNGAFTAALLRNITRDEEITSILRDVNAEVRKETNQKQRPAKYDNLTHVVYLTGKGPAPAPGASVETSATTGTLSLTSDLAGIKVSIDDGQPVETPTSVELSPGTHSIHALQTLVEDTYYAEQPKQWVAVAAGAKMTVPMNAKAAKADLAIRLVPDGYNVFINNERVGVTPLDRFSVTAGVLNIRFERSGEPPHTMRELVRPGDHAVASWGYSSELPAQLPRRSIALDGKTDSWAGIEPFSGVTTTSSTFMGEERYAIKQFYMCRDDKYLYWRMDFAGTNPVFWPPKGTQQGITCLLVIYFDPPKQLNLGATYWAHDVGVHEDFGMWDNAKRQYSKLSNTPTVKNDQNMLVARIGLDQIAKYCKGPVAFNVVLQHQMANGEDHVYSETRYVDFAK
jgi:hypothetical protein